MIMKSKMKNTVKQHPFSTVLFVIYFAISILQGSLELFLVSFLAAFGASRNCTGRPRSSGLQTRRKQRSAA